jgi:hypothetical protein
MCKDKSQPTLNSQFKCEKIHHSLPYTTFYNFPRELHLEIIIFLDSQTIVLKLSNFEFFHFGDHISFVSLLIRTLSKKKL